MRIFVCLVALLTFTAFGQIPRPIATAAQAKQYEAALRSNPKDRASRSALLEYYFRNPAVPASEAIPARRAHILWLIQNTPADPLAGGSSATIDAAGHRLADAEGFKQASEAWRAQVAKPDAAAQTLLNAAYFFKLSDRPLTVSLLERAIAMDPKNPETGARLGDQYAATILGITMVNGNGYPTRMDPSQTKSAAALQARAALESSPNPYVLAKAGYMLSFQGSILRAKLGFDPFPIAEKALQRALSLAPRERDVAEVVRQARALQQQVSAAQRR